MQPHELGEMRSDLKTILRIQEKHSDQFEKVEEKFEKFNEVLQILAANEIKMSNIIESNKKQDIIIENLKKKVESNDKVTKNIKWAFGIVTAIFVGVSIAGIKGVLGF